MRAYYSHLRGLGMVEVIIAAALLLYASFAFLSIYSTTTRYEIHSENRVLASLIGDSILEEIHAHPYGAPPPSAWKLPLGKLTGSWYTVSPEVWIEGRKIGSDFHIQWLLKNGSFIGRSSADSDLVTVVISWREPGGTNDNKGQAELAGKFYQDDNRHLIVQIPVWRQP